MSPRERRKNMRAKTHTVPLVLVSFFGFLLIAAIAFGVGMMVNVTNWLKDLPDYTSADAYLVSEPTTILDAGGNEIASLYVENRTNITKDQCSQYVLDGTVATEDERFYDHGGVDIIGIMRAAVSQLTGGSEGGSTITQQLVRNTILSEEQFDNTLERKVREAYLAIQMEKIFSKDEILMMYLNTVPFGHGAYGIQAASETYFSKNASDLTLAEAALLVGLPNGPSLYDPTINPDLALQRRNLVLDRMLSNGYISQEEHDAAQAEPITLNVSEAPVNGVYSSPYFVDYVKQLLSEEFSTDVLYRGGLTVQTTLDPTAQQAAEDAIRDGLANFGDSTMDGALVAIDPDTGYIKAMVGGKDYYSTATFDDGVTPVSGQENMVTSTQRGCGSTFKTITLAAAINAGMNPSIIINCNSGYKTKSGSTTVNNINNGNYGNISLARATELSSNTGYVQVAEVIGNDTILDMAKALGVDVDIPESDTMTLGPNGMPPLNMAEIYATLAANGTHRDPVAITQILSRSGEVLYQHADAPEQTVDASVAAATREVLEGVVANGTGRYGNPDIDQPVFGKTGTTDGPTDLWFAGATPQLAVAIWTGHRDNSKIYHGGRTAQTSQISAPIFKEFMEEALAGVAREEFPTAKEPVYKANSSWDFSGHLNGSSSSSSSSSDDGDSSSSSSSSSTGDEPAIVDEGVDTSTPAGGTSSGGSSTSGGNAGTSTGGSTGSGGTSSGGSTSGSTGGSTGGGTTGGSSGGGETSSGGGSASGGGTTGGESGTGGAETGGGSPDPVPAE